MNKESSMKMIELSDYNHPERKEYVNVEHISRIVPCYEEKRTYEDYEDTETIHTSIFGRSVKRKIMKSRLSSVESILKGSIIWMKNNYDKVYVAETPEVIIGLLKTNKRKK